METHEVQTVEYRDMYIGIGSDFKSIQFFYDTDACVWIATSDDIRGMVLEDCSLERLKERVKDVAIELVELNGLPNKISRT